MMRWEDHGPHPGIDLGAVAAKVFRGEEPPLPPKLYRICILKVTETEPLPPAFAEFWRRLLTEGVEGCSGNWRVLLFQMNLLGGGFSCLFTDSNLERDEPPVLKFSSEALAKECYELPDRESGDPREVADYQQLEDKCLALLTDAVQSEPAASLLQRIRGHRDFSIRVCDFYRKKSFALTLG